MLYRQLLSTCFLSTLVLSWNIPFIDTNPCSRKEILLKCDGCYTNQNTTNLPLRPLAQFLWNKPCPEVWKITVIWQISRHALKTRKNIKESRNQHWCCFGVGNMLFVINKHLISMRFIKYCCYRYSSQQTTNLLPN